jgi:hypothetical protein
LPFFSVNHSIPFVFFPLYPSLHLSFCHHVCMSAWRKVAQQISGAVGLPLFFFIFIFIFLSFFIFHFLSSLPFPFVVVRVSIIFLSV